MTVIRSKLCSWRQLSRDSCSSTQQTIRRKKNPPHGPRPDHNRHPPEDVSLVDATDTSAESATITTDNSNYLTPHTPSPSHKTYSNHHVHRMNVLPISLQDPQSFQPKLCVPDNDCTRLPYNKRFLNVHVCE